MINFLRILAPAKKCRRQIYFFFCCN